MNMHRTVTQERATEAAPPGATRPWMVPHRRSGLDVTAIPGIRWLLQNPWPLRLLRVFTGLLFALALYALWRGKPHEVVGVAILWGIFWPLFTAMVTPTIGNAFCAVCPHGAMGRVLTRFGLQRDMPVWLRRQPIGLTLILLTYWVVALSMVGGFVMAPALTFWYFVGFTVLAAGCFLAFRGMAYCKHVCPLGGVLTATATAGASWITTRKQDCASCTSFDCARACAWRLSPFRFEAEGSMRDCTLCMKCVQACPSVQYQLRLPGEQFSGAVNRPALRDAWVLLLIHAVAAMAIQLLHGVGHGPWKEHTPWHHAGVWLAQATGTPEWWSWGNFCGLSLAVALTLGFGLPAYRAAGRVAGTGFATTFQTLAYGLAPLACIVIAAHALLFFSTFHAHRLVNGVNVLFGLGFGPAAPFATRRDAWIQALEYIPYLAIAWTLFAVWQRARVLAPAASRARQIAIWALGAVPVWLFIGAVILKLLPMLLAGGGGHHNH